MASIEHSGAATAPLIKTGAAVATYGGSAGAVFFGLKADEFAALAGVVIALLGLIVTWWYKHKHYKLAEHATAARLHGYEADE
jgi:hypothetical protein